MSGMEHDIGRCQTNGVGEKPAIFDLTKFPEACRRMAAENRGDLKTVAKAMLILGEYGVISMTEAQKAQFKEMKRLA